MNLNYYMREGGSCRRGENKDDGFFGGWGGGGTRGVKYEKRNSKEREGGMGQWTKWFGERESKGRVTREIESKLGRVRRGGAAREIVEEE